MKPALFLALVATCTCSCAPDQLVGVSVDLAARPTSVGFGSTAVGAAVTRSVEIAQRGRGTADLRFEVRGDGLMLSGSEAQVRVVSGQTLLVRVTFTPASPGAHVGVLTVGDGHTLIDVPLEGTAVTPQSCPATDPCTAAAFDVATAACVESPVSSTALLVHSVADNWEKRGLTVLASDGGVVTHCNLADHAGGLALGAERLFVVTEDRLSALHAPGIRPAARGFTAERGNPARNGRARGL